MGEGILGFEVRTSDDLGEHDFILYGVDRMNREARASGYVGGRLTGPISIDLSHLRHPTSEGGGDD